MTQQPDSLLDVNPSSLYQDMPSSRQGETISVPSPEKKEETAKVIKEPTPHLVHINNADENKKRKYPTNYVRTTKYTILTFIPIFLWEQAQLYYNFFFILVMIFSLIPNVSPTTPVTSILPVVFILGSAALREAFEDLLRLRNDYKANSRKVKVIRNGVETLVSNANILVGDFVRVEEDEEFPADLLAISCSAGNGVAKIETSSLDGETNLKLKKCLTVTNSLTSAEVLQKLHGQIECPKPNAKMTQFNASLKLKGIAVDKSQVAKPDAPQPVVFGESYETNEALTIDNLLLRGASLKKTQFVYGLVLYTGRDTKLLKNYKKGKSKFSFLDSRLNQFLIFLLIVHQAFTIMGTILTILNQRNIAANSYYLKPIYGDVDAIFVVSAYLTHFIGFNLFVPMSLFVSLQFVKALQAAAMKNDKKMWDGPNARFNANTSNLNSDLSQVQIIFSDKTGTLTQNEMIFKKCGIRGGFVYNEGLNPGMMGKVVFKEKRNAPNIKDYHASVLGAGHANAATTKVELQDTNDSQLLVNKPQDHEKWVREALMCLSLCNSVIPDRDKEGKLKYEGESPDEVALLFSSGYNGYKLLDKDDYSTTLELNSDKQVKFEVYASLGFTSERARMSVVAKNEEGEIICYIKGADSRIAALLKDDNERNDKVVTETVHAFANEGLRTLLMGRRVLDPKWFETWRVKYQTALNDISSQRDKLIEACAKELEVDFELIGSTAIEDRLQDQVPETIAFFKQAGIQIWMLTGDKKETAQNVGISCRLIDKNVTRVNMCTKSDSFEHCQKQLEQVLLAIPEASSEVAKFDIQSNSITTVNTQFKENALLIDGESLNYVFGVTGAQDQSRAQQLLRLAKTTTGALKKLSQSGKVNQSNDAHAHAEELKKIAIAQKKCFDRFVAICKYCSVVICCRANPSQKALMVRMVSKKYGKLGLAVGDGMNDVSMIQEARVGVGILGKEGSQASRSADYSIPSFRHLRRLVAVYGRYSLLRTGAFVQYSFYKNVTLTFTQIFFGFFTLYSGQTILDSWILTFYNMIFTLLPPFLFGLFEKDIDEETIERHPEIYKEFMNLSIINYKTFATWLLQAVYHAAVIFFFTYAVVTFSDSHLAYHGYKQDDIWLWCGQFGLYIHITVTLKACLMTNYWPVITIVVMLFSLLSSSAFYLVYSIINVSGQTYSYYVAYILFTSPKFYLTAFLVLVAALSPDVLLYYGRRFLYPYRWEQLQAATRNDRQVKLYMPLF